MTFLTPDISRFSTTLGSIILLLLPCSLHAQEEAPKQEQEQPAKQKATPGKSRIHLTNGDTLRGTPLSVDNAGNLLFRSDSLRNTALFPLKEIDTLRLHSWKPRKRPETIARVTIQPRFSETQGDTLMGTLEELTAESIKLNTWYGGTITLKRSMVSSLKILSNSPGNYYGPNNISEWSLPSGEDTWKMENAALVSEGSGSIGKDVKLTDKTHLSFNATWKSSMRFKIHLYSDDVKSTDPDACYEISLNGTYAQLIPRGKFAQRGRGFFGGAGFKRLNVDREKKHARFDFFADRKTGAVIVYIDGKQACLLQSNQIEPENLGTAIAFIADRRYPVEISAITTAPWNGSTLPGNTANNVAAPKNEDDDKKDAPHKIILKNGDEIPGTVGKVQDGRMIIKTELTAIKVPIKRIKSLTLGGNPEAPIKYPRDIRAWLHEGGHITIRLESFKDGKINGYSQATGNVSLDLAAFNRIDFIIYESQRR